MTADRYESSGRRVPEATDVYSSLQGRVLKLQITSLRFAVTASFLQISVM